MPKRSSKCWYASWKTRNDLPRTGAIAMRSPRRVRAVARGAFRHWSCRRRRSPDRPSVSASAIAPAIAMALVGSSQTCMSNAVGFSAAVLLAAVLLVGVLLVGVLLVGVLLVGVLPGRRAPRRRARRRGTGGAHHGRVRDSPRSSRLPAAACGQCPRQPRAGSPRHCPPAYRPPGNIDVSTASPIRNTRSASWSFPRVRRAHGEAVRGCRAPNDEMRFPDIRHHGTDQRVDWFDGGDDLRLRHRQAGAQPGRRAPPARRAPPVAAAKPRKAVATPELGLHYWGPLHS